MEQPMNVKSPADGQSLLTAGLGFLTLELDALNDAIGSSLERAHKARNFIFSGGENLSPGIIEISGIATHGTSNFSLRFDITDRFRERGQVCCCIICCSMCSSVFLKVRSPACFARIWAQAQLTPP